MNSSLGEALVVRQGREPYTLSLREAAVGSQGRKPLDPAQNNRAKPWKGDSASVHIP